MHGTGIAQGRNATLRSAATIVLALAGWYGLHAQTAAASVPIAIVPINSDNPNDAAVVTGALEVTAGKAMIAASGSVTSGTRTTDVILPRRGTLRVCAATTVKLAADNSVPAEGSPSADSSVPAGGSPGLLMAMDHGAVEMSFATTPEPANADILMTPDFRILIGGPGASEVKVRLGSGGDTCVDNSGKDAPYVVVTSLFDSGLYRVQPGQRVMFQHGSLREVVDNETEPCGCPPPPAKTPGNEFPLAQSEGLAPTPPPVPTTSANQNSAPPQVAQVPHVAPLVYSAAKEPPAVAQASASPAPAPAAAPAPVAPATKKKSGPFARFGHFLKRIFGAD